MSILSVMIFLPLIGSVLASMIKTESDVRTANSKNLAVFITGVELVFSMLLLIAFNSKIEGFQFVNRAEGFIFGNGYYHVGLDGFSVLMLFASNLLFFTAVQISRPQKEKAKRYMSLMLALQGFVIGALSSLDVVMFYMFLELISLPAFFLIAWFGAENIRVYAAFKFLIYNIAGALLLFAAIILIYPQHQSIDALDLSALPEGLQKAVWMLMFLSFGIKMAVFPLNNWLAVSHSSGPNPLSMILSGVILKVGLLGFMRLCLFPLSGISSAFAPYVIGIIIVTILHAAMVTIIQKDFKKQVAYSSIVYMGICLMGAMLLSASSVMGSYILMLSHSLIACVLFFSAEVLSSRGLPYKFKSLGGLSKKMPVFAIVFVLGVIAALGFPLTMGFSGELLIFMETYDRSLWLGFALMLTMVAGASYMLNMYRKIFLGAAGEEYEGIYDLTSREKLLSFVIIGLLFINGTYPGFVTDVLRKAIPLIERLQ